MSTLSEPGDRIALIRTRLAALEPSTLEIEDDSHLHAGHEGTKNGAGHYRVTIVASRFVGLTTVAQHRLVYHYLQDLIPFPMHALALNTKISL